MNLELEEHEKCQLAMPQSEPREMVLLGEAMRMLAVAKTLDEVKLIRDKAEAMRSLVRQRGMGLALQNDAAEIKIRAERRAGEILAVMERQKPGEYQASHDVTLAPSLSDLGIHRMESHRWQRMAAIPTDLFETHVADTKGSGKELTTAGVVTMAKSIVNAERNQSTIDESTSTDSLDSLVSSGRKFPCIYADPPWQYGNQATRAATDNHYPTMGIPAIKALPIAQLAADNAHLHLWTTNAFLFECQDIMREWGFEYKSCFLWVKPQMGIGNYWRVSHEFMLFGIRGKCPFINRSQMSWMNLPRTKHSAKPIEVRRAIEKVSPGPRLELFARIASPGWTAWGNQISEGEPCMFSPPAMEAA